VALTPSLDVLPYPKPMSLWVDDARSRKQQFSPAELGVQRPPAVLRPAAVFLVDRQDEGYMPPVLTEMPIEEALAFLAGHTSLLASLDRPLHVLADLVHTVGGVHRVAYREADDLVGITQRLLNEDAPHPLREAQEPEPTLAELTGASDASLDGREHIARRPFTDLYLEDGVGCVMVDEHVVALSPMATRIVTLLRDGAATVEQMTEALVAEFGSPDSGVPVAFVDQHVDDLVGVGVLERSPCP
jgi:hypothetical protein